MDPVTAIQVAASAFQFADICVKIVVLIKNARKVAGNALSELAVLEREVETTRAISSSVKQVFDELEKFKFQLPQDEQQNFSSYAGGILDVVRATQKPLQDLQEILDTFQLSTDDAATNEGTIQAFRTLYRGHRKKGDIQRLHREITSGREQLQAYYSALSIMHLMRSHRLTISSLGALSSDIQSVSGDARGAIDQIRVLSFQLKKQRNLIERADHPVDSLLDSVTWNQYFLLLRPVESFYTGREDLLEELKKAFDEGQVGDHQFQRRFVVHGFPGSGKTEFSNKFAVQYRESYWGIFVVDASTPAHATNSFCRIARYVAGKNVEQDISAAKQWLADCRSPWLLIIDNADDPKLEIKEYFPPGNTGCVLITTRNWDLRSEGNVGKRFYSFERLEKSAAKEVLMGAAGEMHPWKPEMVVEADKISDELHCLPLALVYAGKAIRRNLCTWKSYITWYQDTREKYSKNNSQLLSSVDENVKLTVIPTFEPLLRRLEESEDQTSIDARHLMYIFGYIHHSNITSDLLREMVVNANIDGFSSEDDIPVDEFWRPPPLKRRFREHVMRGAERYKWLFVSETTLPDVLRSKTSSKSQHSHSNSINKSQHHETSTLDENRLRTALSLLEGMALIKGYKKNLDVAYSLHPLVHTWVRERMPKLWRRAVWCEAAAQALSQCIVLEPKAFAGQSPSYFDPARLLPHVDSLRSYQEAIEAEYHRRQTSHKMLSWPPVIFTEPHQITRMKDSQRLVQWSLVYSQTGKYHKAEELQSKVRARAIRSLGLNDNRTIQISLALAETMRNLGEFTKSFDLQNDVVKACEYLYGPHHFTTLENVDRLGLILLYHGRLMESLECHQRALDGFAAIRQRYQKCRYSDKATHEKYDAHAIRCRRQALIAQSHLGTVRGRYLDWKDSKVIIAEALAGLTELDPEDDEVSWAQENLAFSCCELPDEPSRRQAYELMLQVREKRQKRLGEQHPYTLWAHVNLGRALWKLHRYDEALEEIGFARKIASMTLGTSHFGFLAGETVRGCILTDKGDFDEAHQVLATVDRELEKISIERGVDHLDRIIALRYQMNLFEVQERFAEAIATGQKVLELLRNINKEGRGVSHPFYAIVESKVHDLEDMMTMEPRSESLPLKPQELVQRRIPTSVTW